MGSHLDTPQWGAFELKMMRRRQERLRRRARRRRLVAVALTAALGTGAFVALRLAQTSLLHGTAHAGVEAPPWPLPARTITPAAGESLPGIVADPDVARIELQPPLADPAPTDVATPAVPTVDPLPAPTGTSGLSQPLATEAPASGAPGPGAPGPGAPGLGAPGLGAPGLGAPGLGAPGLGAPGLSGPALPSEPAPSLVVPISSLPVEREPAPEPVAAPAPLIFDAGKVREAIDAYRDAYQRLDAEAARAVWPSVDAGALARAFRDLASQRVDFDGCVVSGEADSAQATCTGRTTFVPRVGGASAVTAAREWRFRLRREGAAWVIESAEVR